MFHAALNWEQSGETVQLLLEAGAEVDAKDDVRVTLSRPSLRAAADAGTGAIQESLPCQSDAMKSGFFVLRML